MTPHTADIHHDATVTDAGRHPHTTTPTGPGTTLVRAMAADPRRRWAAALATAAAYGVLAGLWTPRGPVTAFEALSAMALAGLTGFVVGVLLRSRWASLVAPVVFVAVFELVRLRVAGPTV